VRVVFVEKNGQKREVIGKEGMSVLDVAHANDVDLEGVFRWSVH